MDVKAVLPDLVQDVDEALRQTLSRVEDDSFNCAPHEVENILKIFKASLLLWQGHLELLQMHGPNTEDWMVKQIPEISGKLAPAIAALQHKLEKMPDNVVSLEGVRQRRPQASPYPG